MGETAIFMENLSFQTFFRLTTSFTKVLLKNYQIVANSLVKNFLRIKILIVPKIQNKYFCFILILTLIFFRNYRFKSFH